MTTVMCAEMLELWCR